MGGKNSVLRMLLQLAINDNNRLAGLLNNLIQLGDIEKARVDDNHITAQIEQELDGLPLLTRVMLTVRKDQLAPMLPEQLHVRRPADNQRDTRKL